MMRSTARSRMEGIEITEKSGFDSLVNERTYIGTSDAHRLVDIWTSTGWIGFCAVERIQKHARTYMRTRENTHT